MKPIDPARPLVTAKMQTTRTPVEAPTTFAEFLVLLYRAVDEGPMAARTGERLRGRP